MSPPQPLRAVEHVTPVVLAFNEEANLARTLDSLRWAKRVLVVDSGSTDATLAIASSYPNVYVVTHAFEDHGSQWAHAVDHPAITTPYVLALDADMALGDGLLGELERRVLTPGLAGAVIGFEYRVGGRALLGSLYPPDLRLFDRTRVRVMQVGHTQRFEVSGSVVRLRARLVHDDRKPLERFVASQMGYSAYEHRRISRGEALRFRDRLRRWGLMSPAVFLLAYMRAGGVFRHRAALRYAHERSLYEVLLALRLMEGPCAGPSTVREPGAPRT